MQHSRVETVPSTSGLDDIDRIKELLRELWEARKLEIPHAESPDVERIWHELEQIVSHQLDRMLAEELALQE